MNTYTFSFLMKPTTAPVAGDANALTRLCRQIGYLIGVGGTIADYFVRPGITGGAFVAADATANNPLATLRIDCAYRLPGSLEPSLPNGTTTGEVIASGSISAVQAVQDDSCGMILSNLDKPIVTAGSLIVAYLDAGVDVSDQLATQINLPVCAGQRLVIGHANQTAATDVYATPFSAAWGKAIIGAQQVESDVKPIANNKGIK